MEAYLDWQKSGGIKLNDVIEEYKYVANGKSVKKGDFLTYVGEDVAPAIEPPFNAVALSSGVGGPEFVEGEVTKTGNIFPTSGWNVVTEGTKYSSSDGYILEASNYHSAGCEAYLACDESAAEHWTSVAGLEKWIKMTLPKAIKITKMRAYIASGSPTGMTTRIEGSKNGSEWTTLYTFESWNTSSTNDFILTNTDYYKYYRIYITHTSSQTGIVNDWQTSEYTAIEQIPSTEHNEQVKIARVYKEVDKLIQGDMIPKVWNKISDTQYTADGIILKSSSVSETYTSQLTTNYGFDGDETTKFCTSNSTNSRYEYCMLEFEKPIEITKMYIYIGSADASNLNVDFSSIKIQGSNDNNIWTDLFDIPISTKDYDYKSTITLNNTKKYKYYRIYAYVIRSALMIYEWQTSEYIATEVIQ